MIVSVYKTTLKENEPLTWLASEFAALPFIANWNVDFEDCDKILRVVSTSLLTEKIIAIVTQRGYDCIELD